jgi:hypothetical protein
MNAFDAAASLMMDDENITVEATYTPSGGEPVDLRISVERDVQSLPQQLKSQSVSGKTEIEFLASTGIAPKRGDMIQTDAESWQVQGLESNDGHFIRVSVK